MNIKFVMHWVKIYLGSSVFSFYQGMVRTMKISFYKLKKNITRSVPLFLLHRNLRFGTENYVVF